MANTPDTNTQRYNFEREDPQAKRRSTMQQWEMLRHLLHLPAIDELPTRPERDIATTIAQIIAIVRGRVAAQNAIRDLLEAEFRAENVGTAGERGAPPVSEAIDDRGVAIADSWLKVIYRNIGDEDVRQMINQLPPAIRTLNINNEWIVNNVDFGVWPDRRVIIDLQHPIWARGNRNQIEERIRGLAPDAAGIRLRPPDPPIANIPQTAIDHIFHNIATQDVIDTLLPIRVIELDSPAGHRTSIDLPALLRLNPQVARMNPADLTDYLMNTLSAAQFNEHVLCFNNATGQRVLPFPGSVSNAVRAMFRALNRTPSPGTTLCHISISLTEALNRRAPTERLLAGAADNRELLLALTVLQRDPSVAVALNANSQAMNNLNARRRIVEGIAALRAYQNIQLPAQAPAGASIDELQTFRVGVVAQVTALETAESAWRLVEEQHQRDVQADQREMSAYESELRAHGDQVARNQTITQQDDARLAAYNAAVIAATRAGAPPPGPPPTPTPLVAPPPVRPKPGQHPAPIFAPISVGAPVACTIRSADELRTKLSEFRSLIREIGQHIVSLQQRGGRLERIVEELQRLQIQNLPTVFPLLVRFVAPVSPPVHIPGEIRVNTDWDAIAREIERSMPDGLKALADYDNDIKEEGARSKVPEGSDACWAIIRRGLEHRGLRDKALDNTLHYMKARLELTPESSRDTQMLAEAAFPYLPPEGERAQTDRRTMTDWNRGKHKSIDLRIANGWERVRQYLHLPVSFNPWEQYRDRLFTRERIGMEWNAHLRNNPTYRIPQLVETYFKMKYLMGLPAEDPRRLPTEMPAIVDRMRNLHEEILRRMRDNFNVATGAGQMTERDVEQLRAWGMNVSMDQLRRMTPTQKLEAIQGYLLDGMEAYRAQNQETIERIANDAYSPVRRRAEAWDWRFRTLNNLTWRNPHLSAGGFLSYVYYRGPRWVLGKVWKGARRVKDEVVGRKKGLGWGTAIGFLTAGPLGAAVGAGIGMLVTKKEGGTPSH